MAEASGTPRELAVAEGPGPQWHRQALAPPVARESLSFGADVDT